MQVRQLVGEVTQARLTEQLPPSARHAVPGLRQRQELPDPVTCGGWSTPRRSLTSAQWLQSHRLTTPCFRWSHRVYDGSRSALPAI